MPNAILTFAVFLTSILVGGWTAASGQELSLDDLFPNDRILDVQITVADDDWDTIRFQKRDMRTEFAASRRTSPPEKPYTYVQANVSIDGMSLGVVGLRKKGFVGSQSSDRPSLKLKLDFVNENAELGGLKSLTLNNNRQDGTVMYQFMGYDFFNSAGTPAPRCAFAKVTVNGENLGVYSHVETVRKPILERGFGNDQGTLYEGTVVDFYPGWEGSLEHKVGNDEAGREKIRQLIEAMKNRGGERILGGDAEGRAKVLTKEEYELEWQGLEFDDSSWRIGQNGAGYETQTGYENLISDSFDFEEELFNKGTSACLRFSFALNDLGKVNSAKNLALMMKNDDGFVAWLNGVLIASSNAPGRPRWNSKANGQIDDRGAMQFAAFDITDHRDLFREGKNVLAIQALNIDSSSSDMLCVAEIQTADFDFESAIADHVDLDSFYRFWAIEGLLGFWDGYTANRNNFFIYLNPETNKFHFMPWGADALFVKNGYLQRNPSEPVCVKSSGIIAHKLYQTQAGRDRIAAEVRKLLKEYWNEEELLAEVDRIEALVEPHLNRSQKLSFRLRGIQRFIRARRADVERELERGLKPWPASIGPPPIMEETPESATDEN